MITEILSSAFGSRKPPAKRRPSANGGNGPIIFLCTPDQAPLEAEQVCRSFGIKVWNRQWADQDSDGVMEARFSVPLGQRKWAASLIAGAGFAVLDPAVKGVKPATRWGVERRAWGPQSIMVYFLETLVGAQYHDKAPVKNSRKRK